MMALETPPDALESFLDVLRKSASFIGCSITYPHKQAVFASVDFMTDRAARLGALNTIRRATDGSLTGDATDGEAMCVAILKRGGKISGASARIIGAGGGAGQAIVDALCNHGISRLVIEENNPARKAQIEKLLSTHWPNVKVADAGPTVDILINASTIGKNASDPSPFSTSAIEAAQTICDVVTSDGVSQLMMFATKHSKITVTGDHMGAEQLPLQLAFLGMLQSLV